MDNEPVQQLLVSFSSSGIRTLGGGTKKKRRIWGLIPGKWVVTIQMNRFKWVVPNTWNVSWLAGDGTVAGVLPLSQSHKHASCCRNEYHNLLTTSHTHASTQTCTVSPRGEARPCWDDWDFPRIVRLRDWRCQWQGDRQIWEPAGSELQEPRYDVALETPDRKYVWPRVCAPTRWQKKRKKKAIFSFPNLFLCTIQWVKYDKMKRWYLVFQNISALHGAV